MFDLFRMYNPYTNRNTYFKEFEDGRRVVISWRRYKKMVKFA